MTQFVLDCSVTVAWCFEDQAAGYADAVLGQLTTASVLVPAIWPLEVANVLLVGERRGQLTEADTARFVALVQSLPIHVDEGTAQRALGEILSVARAHGLSSYDAAYLELAMRRHCPIATLDDSLRRLAAEVGVRCLGV